MWLLNVSHYFWWQKLLFVEKWDNVWKVVKPVYLLWVSDRKCPFQIHHRRAPKWRMSSSYSGFNSTRIEWYFIFNYKAVDHCFWSCFTFHEKRYLSLKSPREQQQSLRWTSCKKRARRETRELHDEKHKHINRKELMSGPSNIWANTTRKQPVIPVASTTSGEETQPSRTEQHHVFKSFLEQRVFDFRRLKHYSTVAVN